MYDKINSEIQVILGEKEVIKKYNCRNSSGDYALKKFLRELYAYEYFNTKKVDFVPRMIGYDKSECWLILENIRGVTLYDLIDAGDINHRKIIDELIKVDRYLFINKITVLFIQ